MADYSQDASFNPPEVYKRYAKEFNRGQSIRCEWLAARPENLVTWEKTFEPILKTNKQILNIQVLEVAGPNNDAATTILGVALMHEINTVRNKILASENDETPKKRYSTLTAKAHDKQYVFICAPIGEPLENTDFLQREAIFRLNRQFKQSGVDIRIPQVPSRE